MTTPLVQLWQNINGALAGINGDYYFGVEAAKGLDVRGLIVPSTLDYLALESVGFSWANISIISVSRAALIAVGLNSAAVVINTFGILSIKYRYTIDNVSFSNRHHRRISTMSANTLNGSNTSAQSPSSLLKDPRQDLTASQKSLRLEQGA